MTMKLFYITSLIALLMAPLSASAMPKTSRTVCGEIQEIEHAKHLIKFLSYSKPEPMIIEINDRTRLFQGGESVPFESLKKGGPVELVYKAPLFGERFALKLRWVTKGELESTVCRRRESGNGSPVGEG